MTSTSTEVEVEVDAHILQQQEEHARLVSAIAIRAIKTTGLKELPDINFEERNSYFPRARYCYHPAHYDAIAVLPGPGTVALPSEDD